MAAPSHDNLEEKPHESRVMTSQDSTAMEEIATLRTELEVLKNANPFRMAELAIEIQIERLRVVEISSARDTAVQRLSEAYISIRQKNELIEQLQQDSIDGRDGLSSALTQLSNTRPADYLEVEGFKTHIATLEKTIEDLRLIIRQQQQQQHSIPSKLSDPPPRYEESTQKSEEKGVQTDFEGPQKVSSDSEFKQYIPPDTDDPTDLNNARNLALAAIPLPENAPDATLSAIVIPPPFTLHEFLNGAPSALRNSLSNYRVLQGQTTFWCPEREEHGYMYVPAFKCSTNPRIATAHRWAVVDVVSRMSKPTECFFNKEGLWYYAGSYKAFRLDTLSPKEWAQLSPETTSAVVKDTIAGRKNISPQNTYETSQLYAAGALKVVCVGLQCVGFNQEVYESLIEYSVKFSETKWKALAAAAANGNTVLGSPNGSAHFAGNTIPQCTSSVPGQSPPSGIKTPALPRHTNSYYGHFHRTSSHLSTGSASSSLGSVSLSLNLGGNSLSATTSAVNSPSALSSSNPTTPAHNNFYANSQSYFTLPGTPASLGSGSASTSTSASISASSGSGVLGFGSSLWSLSTTSTSTPATSLGLNLTSFASAATSANSNVNMDTGVDAASPARKANLEGEGGVE